jgi:hypothetical protein
MFLRVFLTLLASTNTLTPSLSSKYNAAKKQIAISIASVIMFFPWFCEVDDVVVSEFLVLY